MEDVILWNGDADFLGPTMGTSDEQDTDRALLYSRFQLVVESRVLDAGGNRPHAIGSSGHSLYRGCKHGEGHHQDRKKAFHVLFSGKSQDELVPRHLNPILIASNNDVTTRPPSQWAKQGLRAGSNCLKVNSMTHEPSSNSQIKGRIVVAMSGGVDSSVAAALMAEEGYDVVGITLQLYDHGAAVGRKGACCAGQDIHDARRVAETIGIPHYVLDYEERFRKAVIEDFADSYMAGETPIPCVRCNERVKFKDLLETAKDLGAEAMVTGHYIQRIEGPNKVEMHRAVDPDRDQSYFLFSTTQEQLDFLRFPLGNRPKSETRDLAERLTLPVAAKPDSQDICFVPTGSYASIVSKLRPGAIDQGEIVHMDGRVLGTHDGIINFTIGQRRGLKLGGAETAGEPLYVVKLDAVAKKVIVGPKEALATKAIDVATLNWLGDAPLGTDPLPVLVKVRSTMDPVPGTVWRQNGAAGIEACVAFEEPLMGVSPGQAAVLYDAENGSRVLGGGWIKTAQTAVG